MIVETWHGHTPHTAGSSSRLKDQAAGERSRERLIEQGGQASSPAELIAILVRTGLQGVNAVEIGKQLVCKFGSLGAMARASVDDLRSVRGIGRDKAVSHIEQFESELAGKLNAGEDTVSIVRWVSEKVLELPERHHRITDIFTRPLTNDVSSTTR